MNDPGVDEGVKDLTDAQKEVSTSGTRPTSQASTTGGDRFLSPNFVPRPSSRKNSNSSRGSTASGKSQPGGLSKPNRQSLFWERFSHDSRETDGEIDGRRSRGGGGGASFENGSVNSRSPIREPTSPELGADIDEEKNNTEQLDELSKRGQQDEQMPGLYFLLSTVFPLMAATLGPVTNVMSICALVVPWRIYIPPGKTEEQGYRVSDPGWCLAVNAVSLGCGFIANIILLLNLSRRIQSPTFLPFTIGLWYAASILLIVLVSVYSRQLYDLPPEKYVWSQAFFYGIIAAVLYFVIATLLVGNYIGVLTRKYARQFTLTIAQRTLMLQTLSLMCWLCLGAGVFSKLEGWAYLDGIYFCDTTFLVVGLGDYNLTTNAGRALLFPYAAAGIVMVGLVVSSIRGLVLERGKRKVKRRFLEKQRETFVDGDKNGTGETADSEKERFELMRKAQDKADEKRRWMALGVSVSFFLVFWLLGAFVFMQAEDDQQWTYFESLYFAFTTILTIGYGDFHPQSESGKPFFVIWTLLAVPMMTILVSNLGDTVIAIIKNLTLWAGEWTVLPQEKLSELGGHNRWLKTESQRLAHQRLQRAEKVRAERDQEEAGNRRGGLMEDAEDADEKRKLEDIGSNLVNREEKEEEDEGYGSTMIMHHNLASTIQKLLPDLAGKDTKQYTYEEWNKYLELIYPPKEGETVSSLRERRDWLGEDSPLMSRQTETEWLLTKLCGRLEGCLRDQKEGGRRRDKGKSKYQGDYVGHSIGNDVRPKS